MADSTQVNIVSPRTDPEAWMNFARVCIAAMFEVLSTNNETISVSKQRIDDIHVAMQNNACGVSLVLVDGNIQLSALIITPEEGTS